MKVIIKTNMLNKTSVIFYSFSISFSLFSESLIAKNVENENSKLPNIVFILADDMGIGDLECYGQKYIKTPNINELAKHGIQFTQHYSGSTVCAPSRCVLLTGKDTGHAWVRGNIGIDQPEGTFDTPLIESEVTVAQLLKSKNYATACVGKWGLGGPNTEGSPNTKGFDYFFGYLGQGEAHSYYPDFLWENDKKVPLDGKTYSHFLIVDKGLDFIEKNSKTPFFLYMAVTPPHADLDYPDLSQYAGKFPEKAYVSGKNGSYKSQDTPKAAYASMVSEVDKNVGQVIKVLKENGIYDNTIVIFSSDNGCHTVGGADPDYFDSNGPFRGYKRDLYEGGVRAPFIFTWPNKIKEHRVTYHISAFWDFLPTVCDIIGVRKPANINGISYLPTILQNGKKQKEHQYIYFEFYEQGGKQSILKNGWKLVRLNMSKPDKFYEELYYIISDPGERSNVLKQFPEKALELRKLIQKERTPSSLFTW